MNNGKQGTWIVKVGSQLRNYKIECWKNDEKYRYKLKISLMNSISIKEILVIMLNPSTADEKKNNFDPTCRFLINICHSNGYDSITICNLFSFITKYVKILDKNIQEDEPRLNNEILENSMKGFNEILCAWGGPYKEIKNKKILNDRLKEVFKSLKLQKLRGKKILKLKIKKGYENKYPQYPPHPSRKRYNTEFEPYCIEEINIG